MFVWYGFFVVLGEMYFNMWQTEIGAGSVNGAFRYGTVSAVLMFFIYMRDD
jgi:predicted small integral membrane protein